ncbi:unnamed protein product [Brassica oleracea]|uniref:Uncharacterized protein n=1 Tax=Brassica oleracea TaxID=3712 RepID=A0A3P6EJ58_BRAOL|nr:unnamed protein product [Brassica oleracea]
MTHSSRDWPVSVWKVFSYSISFFPFPVMKVCFLSLIL